MKVDGADASGTAFTNEIIREIPPEKILDMVAKMWDTAGLIVDERR